MIPEKFISDINREYLHYLPEVIDHLKAHGLDEYISEFKEHGMYRWYPSEVFDLIAKIDEYRASIAAGMEVVDASQKHIPDFLMK